MPLHVWLPRAHPIAPAPVSALMSGVMIKVAIYGLVRVLVDWVGVLPVWFGVLVLAVGALSAVGGVVYALFQHDLKRLLAMHSIENIGIIVLGIGACLVLRARGADAWAAFALAAALLHTLNHAVFKALLFLGAGAFERAVGSLELDRLGGLLRRMPWTGGAFLVGAMAIAGLPPLNGFASEWLTLQALLHVPAYGHVADGTAGAIALAALAATAALAVFCFVKVVGLVLLGPPRAKADAAAVEPGWSMRGAVVFLALACVVLGAAPGVLFGVLAGLAPWVANASTALGLQLPGTGSLPTSGIALALVGLTAAFVLLRGRRRAAPAPTWACGQPLGRELNWTSAGFTKPLRLVLEFVLRPEREIDVVTERGVVQTVSYSGRVPHLIDERLYGPLARISLTGARRARRLQSGSIGTYAAYLIALVLVLLPRRPHRCDRMSTTTAVSGAVQVLGGLLLAPLLPGLVQYWKAQLQGRRGRSPLQPYRELRRLWGKSAVDVEGTTFVYRLAPPLVAASLTAAVLLVPPSALAPNWGLGHDLLALAGFLALARFALAVASWDVANGFALMGASRDLTISVFVEAGLILSVTVPALIAGTTDLRGMVAGTAGSHVWSNPALGLAAVAFGVVTIAETGRQPVDNPDTHLELTMIHEGPLLEYAGRDLAYLQWASAVRHWLLLTIGAQVFLPHAIDPRWQLTTLPLVLVVLCGGLALVESFVAKVRILLVPRLIAVSAAIALLGIVTWLMGNS